MKKILTFIAVTACLMASTFAVSFAVGGRGLLGKNIRPDVDGYNGLVSGAGAFFNLNLIGGFGFQGELNITTSKIETGDKSVTVTDYQILDLPFMLWDNMKIGPIALGGGLGINFSTGLNNKNDDKNDYFSAGLAAGANIITYFNEHFGIVLGGNFVWDCIPITSKSDSKESVTYYYDDINSRRMAAYASLGLEYKF